MAPTHPYETSQLTQQQQEQSGYFATAGEPLVQETTDSGSPPYVVSRDSMRGVLLASNPAVYSNPLLMKRPNLYEDPATYRAWVASVAASQAMSGGTVPPASATASATREQSVFFDWNNPTLTPEGLQMVDGIASAARGDPAAQIALVGKADLSGTNAYNLRLSQRRADAVRDRLVAEGVAANRIEMSWVGEHEPPVPTANGVREARNRVVDVMTTTMVSSAPAPVILPRRVLFTTTENSPPGTNGFEQAFPGAPSNGSE